MITTRISTLTLLLGVLAAACGGGTTTPLKTASGAPAATGEITASHGDNGNTEVKVEVDHLAPPDKIANGAKVYVVWAKPHSQDPAQNIGALEVGDDRKGKLETKTALKSFDVLVTPEASPTVAQPSTDPVMRGSVAAQ